MLNHLKAAIGVVAERICTATNCRFHAILHPLIWLDENGVVR